MSGMDDNVAVIGDWIPPSPSPRTFFSAILGEEVGSRSIQEPLRPSETQGRFLGSKEKLMLGYPDKKDGAQLEASSNQQLTELGSFSDLKSNSRGGLVERMAARAGFNAPKLNTEGIRPNDVLNPDSRSTLFMISPGLSPTTLLESPVFLSNSLAQPSPTTGKFPFFPPNVSNRGSRLISDTPEVATSKENLFKDNDSSSFAFKPIAESGPSFFGSGGEVNQPMFPQQSFPRIDVSAQSENSISLQPHNAEPTKVQSQRMFEAVPGGAEYALPPLDESQDEEGEQKGNGDSTIGGSEDGFNWRKYGQKQVKGSEYPRSYYKCTHPNCPVKKKVERSHEGHITEIIYKGLHNHPKPPPNRRASIGGPDNPEQGGPHGGVDPEPSWTNVPRGSGSEWKQDNIEVTSSPSEGQDFCNQGATGLQAQNGTGALEHGEAVDVSSTFSNEELEDDQGTNGSVSLAYDAEGDESESKRRKIEAYPTDMSGATRAIREPRVVVQTTSEVDILDDGYRWRKYGQKVVKGNPNPRSYYKCTSAGCTVRKHVERASHDLKSVITTYEGKHNHDVPAARNSSHGNAGTSGSGSLAGQPVQAHAHRPEPSLAHNVMPRFDGPGSLSHFGLSGRPLQLGHGVSFGMAAPNLANLGLAGLGPSHGKLPVHPFLAQQRQMNDMGFMLPKGEAKVEPMSEPGLNLSNNSSAVYQQLMSRLPLGPQM